MKQVDTPRKSEFTTLGVRRPVKRSYDQFSRKRNIDINVVAEIAIKALNALPEDQQDRLILGKPIELPAPSVERTTVTP